jgi:hypothetical protein
MLFTSDGKLARQQSQLTAALVVSLLTARNTIVGKSRDIIGQIHDCPLLTLRLAIHSSLVSRNCQKTIYSYGLLLKPLVPHTRENRLRFDSCHL